MEAVIFDGKEYTKASVLAERFRYTQDYLGQLCRGKKVDARLVGRAWYINLESLEKHRHSRYRAESKDQTLTEISSRKVNKNYLSRIDVEPILKKKTVTIFKSKDGVVTELPVKYEADDHALIPKVDKAAISKNVPILPAGAERVHINKVKSAVTAFKAEPLPEVSLRGRLIVDGIPEAIEETEPIKEPEIKTERISTATKVTPVLTVRPLRKKPIPQARADTTATSSGAAHTRRALKVAEISDKNTHSSEKISPKGDINPKQTAGFTFKPTSVLKREEKVAVKERPPYSWLIPVVSCAFALVLSVLAMTAAQEISAEGSVYDERLMFEKSTLIDFQNLLQEQFFMHR